MTSWPTTITLDGPTDWVGFRRAARALVMAGVAPGHLAWQVGGAHAAASAGDLFAGDGSAVPAPLPLPAPRAGTPPLRVPPDFLRLCEKLILGSPRFQCNK